MREKRDREWYITGKEGWIIHSTIWKNYGISYVPPCMFDIVAWPERNLYVKNPQLYTRLSTEMFTEEDKKGFSEILDLDETVERAVANDLHFFSNASNFNTVLDPAWLKVPDALLEGYNPTHGGSIDVFIRSSGCDFEYLEVPLGDGRVYQYRQAARFSRGVQDPEIGKTYLHVISLADMIHEIIPIEDFDIVENPQPYPVAREVVPDEMFVNINVPGRMLYDDEIYVSGSIVRRK